jgi:[ribosomal protein S5]-alanine N-acetyltransferase
MLLGKQVSIGPIFPEDFGPLFCWANDVVAARLDFAYRPIDLISHRQWCETIGKDPTRIVFAIRKARETAIIGYVQISNINTVYGSADLGIRIGEERFRGQGFGKDALGLALNFCWNHVNLHRVQLTVFKHNQRAIRTYQALGFKKEGLLKQAAFIDGERIDVVVMAVLRPSQRRHRRSANVLRANAVPTVESASAAGHLVA